MRSYDQEVAVVCASIGKVLHVGGDVGSHRNAAGGDILDQVVGVTDGRIADRREVVGD